jgi:hypothetical protein
LPQREIPQAQTPVQRQEQVQPNHLPDSRSLTDEFKRMVAKKENAVTSDDEDAPMWENVRNPPEVENVLTMIPGTVVS